MANEPKIITEFVHPPIPIRSHDWAARRENSDEGDPIGWGATEQDAIDDLMNLEMERE